MRSLSLSGKMSRENKLQNATQMKGFLMNLRGQVSKLIQFQLLVLCLFTKRTLKENLVRENKESEEQLRSARVNPACLHVCKETWTENLSSLRNLQSSSILSNLKSTHQRLQQKCWRLNRSSKTVLKRKKGSLLPLNLRNLISASQRAKHRLETNLMKEVQALN